MREKKKVYEEYGAKECIILDVPGQPHGREVAPAQFADDMIFSVVKISHFYMVVTTYRKTCIPHIESSQLSETLVKLEQSNTTTHLCSNRGGPPVLHHQNPESLLAPQVPVAMPPAEAAAEFWDLPAA